MNRLQSGVGRAIITPKLGTLLMGYPNLRVSDNVLDDLTVTALALQSQDTRSLLLSITTTVIGNDLTDDIRKAVSEATGYDFYQVNVCSWQVHSAPPTQTTWGWGDMDHDFCNHVLIPGCVNAAKAAIADMGDVVVGVATTHSDVGCNRRELTEEGEVILGQNPWGAYDPTMTAIRFLRDGKPYANIIHYGAHPTAIGDTCDITRDWPGIMVDRVESVIGGMTLYLNGAVGDVGPRPGEGVTAHAGIEGMREVGYRAAADAIRACKGVVQFHPVDLEVLVEDIKIARKPLPEKETALTMLSQAEKERGDCKGPAEANYQYWKSVLNQYENGFSTAAHKFCQTITRIGDVAIVPFPGEPFAEIVLRLRRHSPIQHTLSVSTSNGSIGYIVTQDALTRGGYEVNSCRSYSPYLLADNIDDVLVAENLRLLRKLQA